MKVRRKSAWLLHFAAPPNCLPRLLDHRLAWRCYPLASASPAPPVIPALSSRRSALKQVNWFVWCLLRFQLKVRSGLFGFRGQIRLYFFIRRGIRIRIFVQLFV
jgi:hypothetical protein